MDLFTTQLLFEFNITGKTLNFFFDPSQFDGQGLGKIFNPSGHVSFENIGRRIVGLLDGVVIAFSISVKIFFEGEKTADVVTFDKEGQHGKSPGTTAITFDKRMNGDQDILSDS